MARLRKGCLDSVEIHIRKPESFDAIAISDTAAGAGVAISAVGTGLEYRLSGLSFTSPNADVRRRTVLRFGEHTDLAAELKATVFVGLCRGTAAYPEERKERLDSFATEPVPIVDYAQANGAVLSIEPIGAYMANLLNTTKRTLEFIGPAEIGGNRAADGYAPHVLRRRRHGCVLVRFLSVQRLSSI